jgi:hypothetical protein
MELREKIVREAFTKKDLKPLLSHLRATPLGSDGIDILASLLKRKREFRRTCSASAACYGLSLW